MIKKEYTLGDLTVVWQPDLCIHSGICFLRLPGVFKPRERPWIQLEQGEITSIEETVRACPSGAIFIKPNHPISEPDPPEISKVKIFHNGPVRVLSPCKVTLADGSIVEKLNGVSFCRCGGSSNKPFCDGSHKTNGFSD